MVIYETNSHKSCFQNLVLYIAVVVKLNYVLLRLRFCFSVAQNDVSCKEGNTEIEMAEWLALYYCSPANWIRDSYSNSSYVIGMGYDWRERK